MWPELAPWLTLDSTKQKFAQTAVSMRIVPRLRTVLGEEKRFYTTWVIRVDLAISAICPLSGSSRTCQFDVAKVGIGMIQALEPEP